ncbi:hypothetical protein ACFE04_004931 [Oxalis oulophora]
MIPEKVYELIRSPGGGWDVGLINLCFPKSQVEAILSIPLCERSVDDQFIWLVRISLALLLISMTTNHFPSINDINITPNIESSSASIEIDLAAREFELAKPLYLLEQCIHTEMKWIRLMCLWLHYQSRWKKKTQNFNLMLLYKGKGTEKDVTMECLALNHREKETEHYNFEGRTDFEGGYSLLAAAHGMRVS